MFRIISLLALLLCSSLSYANSQYTILFDRAHGQRPPTAKFQKITEEMNIKFIESNQPLTSSLLSKSSLLYLRAPNKTFSSSEKEAIVHYLNQGGSLFLAIDEENRQSLAKNQVNDLITPFSMMLTADTPYLHNCGGITLANEINAKPREIPYSGGRAVVGGTPFAFQIDKDGSPGLPFAAYKSLKSGGRIVVIGEGMTTIFMGEEGGVRLSGKDRDFRNTKYWGADSYIFMEEVISWLAKNN